MTPLLERSFPRAAIVRSALAAALLAVVLGGALACSDAPPVTAETDAFTVRDSAGIEIVENRSAAWADGEGWTVSRSPILSIGAVAGDDAVQFSRIGGVVRLSDGTIVVLEQQARELRYFSAEGVHLRTVGGQGEGPGEFGHIGWVVRLEGDSLMVEDDWLRRETVFGPTGELGSEALVDTRRLYEELGLMGCTIDVLPDRSRVGCVTEPGAPVAIFTESGLNHYGLGRIQTRSRTVWVSPDLERADTLGLEYGLESWGIDRGDGIPFYVRHPFHSSSVRAWTLDPPFVVTAKNPEYSIEIWSRTEGLVRIVRHLGVDLAPTREEREAAWAVVEEREARFANVPVAGRAPFARIRAEVPEPPLRPAIGGIFPVGGGGLCVTRWSPPGSDADPGCDVFDSDGVLMGWMPLPENLNVREFGEDYLLGVSWDEHDVPFVEMYKLDRGGS